ncbi:MAG: AraC family transcriptional regulator [Clostridia bacterium]|nr:AraC family transcriptional regulator [Clostridia bacterium]
MKNELVKSSLQTLPVHIGCGSSVLDCPADCPLHYHDEIELLAILAGEKRVWVDDKEYLLCAGDVAFINARVPHRTEDLPPHISTVLLQFRPESFQNEPIDNRALRHLARFVDNTGENPIRIFRSRHGEEELLHYLMQIRTEYEEKKTSYEKYLQGCIHLILGFLYRTGILCDTDQRFHHTAVKKVMPALTFVDDHYAEDVTLGQLSELCGLSEGYFCRQFKAATGSTLVEYLNFVRIYNAEKLLIRTNLPILDIAMEVGFSSLSYFNRMFRRFKSCSPNIYRHAQYLRDHESKI